MITVTHAEISATTAGRMKGTSAENVAKTVSEYAKSMVDLMNEKKPTNAKDITLVETPLVGYKIQMKENGVKKNPDGTETKIGQHYTFKAAVPKAVVNGLNSEVINGLAKIASAALDKLRA